MVKTEDWFQGTQVYLYRGAWQVCQWSLCFEVEGLTVLPVGISESDLYPSIISVHLSRHRVSTYGFAASAASCRNGSRTKPTWQCQ